MAYTEYGWCMSGEHIWDEEYDDLKLGQRKCISCQYYFLDDEKEEKATEAAVDMNEPKKNKKSGIKVRRREV